MRPQHPIRTLAALLLAAATACASLHPGRRARLDQRDIAVYRAVAESLYVVSAPHEAVALSMSLLDTACAGTTCEPVEKRWGLDSLWWSHGGDDGTMALRKSLLARAGKRMSLGHDGVGDPRVRPVATSAIPGATADSATWRAFLVANGATALLSFSPVGFSPDGRQALVVTRMTCGPRCGHWLGVSLSLRGGAWAIADMLLIASERPATPFRMPDQD